MSKEGKEKWQWIKWSQTALLLDGLTFFPVRDDISMCSTGVISYTFPIIGLIAKTTLKFMNKNKSFKTPFNACCSLFLTCKVTIYATKSRFTTLSSSRQHNKNLQNLSED